MLSHSLIILQIIYIPGACAPGVLGVRRTSNIKSSSVYVYKRMISLRRKAVISCSLMLPLTFRAPELQELVVLGFPSTPHTCCYWFCLWRARQHETADIVVNTASRAVSKHHSLTSVQDCCRWLERVVLWKKL